MPPDGDGKHVIVADFWKPGRVVIFDPATRKLLWEVLRKGRREPCSDHPSLRA